MRYSFPLSHPSFDNHRAHPNRHIVLTRQLTSHANKSLSQIRFPPLPRKSISSVPLPYWLCSTQHILAIVVFMGMALVFTISDPQHEAAAGKRKMMANVRIQTYKNGMVLVRTISTISSILNFYAHFSVDFARTNEFSVFFFESIF